MNTSHWLTIPEAAKAIGRHPRSIERLIEKQQVATAKRPIEGQKPVTIIDPATLEKYKDTLRPAVQETLPAKADNAPRQPDTSAILKALERLRTPPAQKLFLTVREAAHYAGLPQSEIKRLVKAAVIPTLILTNRWRRIARKDLEEYAAKV